jgi:hypothetical protein
MLTSDDSSLFDENQRITIDLVNVKSMVRPWLA